MIESDKWSFCLKFAFTQEVLHFVFIQHNCMENYLPGAPDCHWTEKMQLCCFQLCRQYAVCFVSSSESQNTKRPHRNRLAKSEIHHQDWGTKSPWPGARSNPQLLDERPSAFELRSWPLHFCMQICLGVWFPLHSSKVGVIGMEQCKWLESWLVSLDMPSQHVRSFLKLWISSLTSSCDRLIGAPLASGSHHDIPWLLPTGKAQPRRAPKPVFLQGPCLRAQHLKPDHLKQKLLIDTPSYTQGVLGNFGFVSKYQNHPKSDIFGHQVFPFDKIQWTGSGVGSLDRQHSAPCGLPGRSRLRVHSTGRDFGAM